MKIQGLGVEKYNDGFDVNDEFIKLKIIEILSPENNLLALNMQFMDSCKNMKPDDLISYFIANESMIEPNKGHGSCNELSKSCFEGQGCS